MKACRAELHSTELRKAVPVLLLAGIIALAGAAFAGEDPPPETRVPLVIRAADPDGGELTFNWVQKEGPAVQIADPKARRFDKTINKWVSETYFVPSLPGKYVFEVTVKNEYGLESSKRFVQEILPAPQLPDANAGAPQKKKIGEKVTLSGMDSKAYGNRLIKSFEWSVRQAPEGFTLPPDQLTSRQPEFIAKLPGKYVFELKVFDGKYWSDPPASVEVMVTPRLGPVVVEPDPPEPVPLPPKPRIDGTPPQKTKAVGVVVGAGPFKVGDKVVLDGSASVANPADTPGFIWKQIEREKSPLVRTIVPDTTQPYVAGRLDSMNFPVQSFIVPENGTYRFVLQITTKDNVSVESDPVTVVGGTGVQADPPPQNGITAILTANKSTVKAGEEVTLDGSKSRSQNAGAKLTYIWMPVPGKMFPTVRGDGEQPIVRVSGDKEGEWAVILVVSDGAKQAKSEPIIFTVAGGDKPPVIDLDKTLICNAGETINVAAIVKDPQNYSYTWKWVCIEPREMKIPDQVAIGPSADVQLPRFQFTPKTPGTFLFEITVTSAKGLSATASVQVGVKDAGQLKPTAVINGIEKANVGEKITLSAARSFSPNRKELSYTWRDETPGGPKIKEAPPRNSKEWTITAPEAGRLVITLVVSDGTSESEPFKFAIDVAGPKGKPVAKISGQRSAMAKADVELSADGSTAPDNGPLQYFWAQSETGGGPDLGLSAAQRRAKVLRFTPAKPGTYVLTLYVTDQNNERSNTEQITLDVKGAPAAPPSASAVVLTTGQPMAGKEVRLSAKDSVATNNAPLTYKWKQTKGPELVLTRDNTQEIGVTPAKSGTYELQVTVSDGEQESAPATVTFTIAATAAPKAAIAEITPPNAGDAVVLDGTESKSQNGAALQYEWKQKAGEPVRLAIDDDKKAKIQFKVPAEGTYTWELRVYDGVEYSEPASITFTAKGQAKNAAPVAIVEKPIIVTEMGVETVIDASKSYDPDNGPSKPLTFRWRRGEQVFSQNGAILKFTPPAVGPLQFSVEAFDGKDYSQPFQVRIDVVAPGTLPAAKPKVSPNPAKKAIKGAANQNKIIILDGTDSLPPANQPDRKLTYMWTQTEGSNLTLAKAAMAKDRVGLYIYQPGTYKFQLIVNDGENSSLPVEVELKVENDPGEPEQK